ncbi:MAG: AAA family ATPase [Prochloraceae cyanobacterium]
MTIIPGYEIIELIYQSNKSIVYRAKENNNKNVILKILKQEYPTLEEITRYKQEFEITQNLNIKNAIASYELREYQNTFAIVFEDFGGISLDLFLNNYLLNFENFLKIAIKITTGLAEIHAAKIVHKDLNPSNIVFNPETKQLKIIDFGISTILSKENPTLKNPNTLEGTIAYISPEQTGRMNRPLDYRTDFYSLGVTFYELLTNQLPFKQDDLLELIHCHIAKKPTPPEELNSKIPKAISDIVLKLMAKNAEQRYQSAWGIKVDLENCLDRLQTENKIFQFNFQLGRGDISSKFQIRPQLYGREKEIEILLKALNSQKFPTQLMLISGYSGIGKSALVKEIYKPITSAKGYFISGKFDRYQRDLPYSAIVQAWRQLVKYLLGESQSDLENWKNKILAALKKNGQVIIDLIPEVEQIIGKQPPIPDLGATESQNRFNWVFLEFIKVFAKSEHPLVIFLDDLQWADRASLQIIQLVITEESIEHLFLIGAYRNNEVSAGDPLTLTIDYIRKAKVKVSEISLSALQLSDIAKLIADSFNCTYQTAKPLAELVLAKTRGNPFFINEFLRSLYLDNLLSFNYQSRSWQWDLAQIQSKKFTENVVELLSRSLQKISIETQNILQIAACIGNQFEIKILATAADKSLQETAFLLREAIEFGLVFPLSNIYKSIELNVSQEKEKQLEVEYKFIHDRIRQAAYSLIPPESRSQLHHKIGKLLLKSVSKDRLKEKIFEIVDRLNLGIESILSQQEKDELAKLNLIAGQKAQRSAAYKEAFEYLKFAQNLLGENAWERHYQLTLELYLTTAEAGCLNGSFQAVETWSNQIIARAKNLIDRGRGYKVKILCYFIAADYCRALSIGIVGLKELGITIPQGKIAVNSNLLYQFFKHKTLSSNFTLRVERLPKNTDERGLLLIELIGILRPIAYIVSPKNYLLLTFKQVDLLLKYGISSSGYLTVIVYGIVVAWVLGNIERGYKIARAGLYLSEQNYDPQYRSKILFRFHALLGHSKQHLNTSLPGLLEGYFKGLETGEAKWTTTNIAWYLFHSFIVGKKLEQLAKETAKYTKTISKIKMGSELLFFEYHERAIQILSSQELAREFVQKKVAPLVDREFDDRKKDENLVIFYNNFYLIFCCYLFGKNIEANDYIERSKQQISVALGQAVIPVFYFYDSLNKIALIDRDKIKYQKFFKAIDRNQNKIKKIADRAPMNYRHKYDLVAAELQRIKGNKEKAANLYETAINGAKKYGYINEEALAWELAAKFYSEWEKPTIAKTYTIEACYRYSLWGAKAKVKDLEANYPELFNEIEAEKTQPRKTKSITTTEETELQTFDVNTLLKANRILSRELNLAKLLEKLIKIAIESAGARIGYLILKNNNNLSIEAIGSIESDRVRVLQSIPLEFTNNNTQLPLLPEKIINYVARTHQDIVLDDARSKVEFASDPYIEKIQPKSVLCTPLIDRGKLIGLVYLENNLIAGAFTPDRTQLLKAFCAPAAVSIQNAQLYEERLKAELALRQSEQKLAQFLEALPVGILILTGVGKPYYLNEIAKKITGKGVVDSISLDRLSETYNVYLAGSDRLYPKAKSPIRKALKGQKSYTPDVEIRKADRTIPLDVWTNPIVNERGEVEYVISAFQDISDRKRLEEENLLLQSVADNLSYSYQVGGGLAANTASYVIRDADCQLYQEILQAKLCYIFNSRQMGKSSLRNKIMSKLRSKGYRCGAIDLTEIGSSNLNQEQWYASFIFNLAKSLSISQFNDRKHFSHWWKSLDPISAVSKFKEFICEIILKNIDNKIAIFIDEIDSLRRLSFDSNDFLALIRFLYEHRSQNSDLNRLCFVLLGAANPHSLISDRESTPFNIGTYISLEGFKIKEITPLARGLDDLCDDSTAVLQEILSWTGGQPFLTQKICYFIKQSRHNIAAKTEAKAIETLVTERIIKDWKTQDNPAHFQVIEQNILNSPNREVLLTIYRQILASQPINIDDSNLKMELILSGLVCDRAGSLHVFNRIYASIFNLDWISRHL